MYTWPHKLAGRTRTLAAIIALELAPFFQFLMTGASSPSAGKRSAPASPSSRGNSPTHERAGSSPSTPSFFIIQEPVVHPAPRDQSPKEKEKPPEASVRVNLDKQRTALASRQSHELDHSLNSGSPGPRRHRQNRTSSADAAAVLHEETEEDLMLDRDEDGARLAEKASKPRVLSILNRCGSSPELPLHNTWSTAVFSSSKKRQLLKATGGTGGSPHFTAMQRSRLIPLPINIRTGTLKKPAREDDFGMEGNSTGSLRDATVKTSANDDAEEQKLNYEISIATLKQRVAHMEKELSKALKHRHALDKQIECVIKENQALLSEKKQLVKKMDDLEKSNMQQRHTFDKLSERYALVYENLSKLTDIASGVDGGKQNNPGYATASTQQVLQTLARENQELQRKVRVLEARHAEDKTIVANQEKQIRRLRGEMEALQHMAGSNDSVSSKYSSSAVNSPTHQSEPNRVQPVQLATGTTSVMTTVSNPATWCEESAYIDPNILKVLEKVDSQFSITNAITLASVLKKWLHSSLNVVASTDLHGVLHVLLKRACELLHCQHAAIFHVDHVAKKMIGVASERGLVHWEMPLDKGILGHAARSNVICNVRKAYDDPRFYSTSDSIMGTKSHEVLCIPLTRELERDQTLTSGFTSSPAVFAVIQCWNTTTQKPFSQNDQILGGLLAIQAGVVLTQTKLVDNMQRVHNRVLQIVRMDEGLAAKATTAPSTDGGESPRNAGVSIVHLVRAAQRKLAEIMGITKLRIFILDADLARIWHVGAQLDSGSTGAATEVQLVRKYANVRSSLCGLLVGLSSASEGTVCASRILLDPTAEPTFNDTVDLKGGAHGLYIVPIRSPWRNIPLGMIQIARSGLALGPTSSLSFGDAGAVAKVTLREKQHAQNVEDTLALELVELFCRQFASLLHHALALQAFETCPVEIRDAQLAYLVDHLDVLEKEYLREQEAAEAEAETMTRYSEANARLEQKLLQSALQDERAKTPTTGVGRPISGAGTRPTSGALSRRDLEPQPLISTDSTYAIDVTGFGDLSSSPDSENSKDDSASARQTSDDGSAASSFSPSDTMNF